MEARPTGGYLELVKDEPKEEKNGPGKLPLPPPCAFTDWIKSRVGFVSQEIDYAAGLMAKLPGLAWNGPAGPVLYELKRNGTPPGGVDAVRRLYQEHGQDPIVLPPPVDAEAQPMVREIKTYVGGKLVGTHTEKGATWRCPGCKHPEEQWADPLFENLGKGLHLTTACPSCGRPLKVRAAAERRVVLATEAGAAQVIAAHRLARAARAPVR